MRSVAHVFSALFRFGFQEAPKTVWLFLWRWKETLLSLVRDDVRFVYIKINGWNQLTCTSLDYYGFTHCVVTVYFLFEEFRICRAYASPALSYSVINFVYAVACVSESFWGQKHRQRAETEVNNALKKAKGKWASVTNSENKIPSAHHICRQKPIKYWHNRQ